MKYEIEILPSVEKSVAKWKKSKPTLHKKFKKIVGELLEHPRTGSGKPEALVGGNDIRWSRRLSAHERIIYDIYDDVVTVLIIQVGGHYKDK